MAKINAVTMPKWGLEMTEGTVTKWHLAEGQKAVKGGDLADIETAKIVNTIQMDFDGAVRRLVANPGDTLPVGALIAVVADPSVPDAEIDGFAKSFKPINLAGVEAEGESAPAVAASEPAAAAAAAPQPTATTAKTLNPAEAEARNVSVYASPLARRLANKLGIDMTGLKGTGSHGRVSQGDVEAEATRLHGPSAAATPAAVSEGNADSVRAGPAARKLAAELGVNLAGQTATGPKNTLLKEDVLRGAQGQQPSVSTSEFDLLPLNSMRKTIASVLTRSKQTIPHFYLSVDFEMDKLIALRGQINASRADGQKLSITDLLLRAVALSLAAVPDVNVHFTDEGIKRFRKVNLSLAVAIDGGLMTPVIRDAAAKSVSQLAQEAADIASKARARTLTGAEMAEGTFTLSNLGMFGIRQFDAVINPPQGAILATGKIRREAVELPDGGVAFQSVMAATLSCDHRAIDGALGAKFLAALSERISNPLALLL